jgi:AraC-type DNA-binding domain-containing proteins
MEFVKLFIDKPLEYLLSGHFISTGDWIHADRILDSFEVIIGLSGTLYICQDNIEYEVEAGDVLFLVPGHRHWGYKVTEKNDNLSHYWLHFRNDNLKIIDEKELLSDVSLLKNNPDYKGLNNIAYIPLFSHIHNISRINILCRQLLDFSNTTYYTSRIIDHLTTTLIFEISHQTIDDFSKQKLDITNNLIFTNIVAWIKINLNNNISLKDVANKFNFNKNYLARLFKQKMGVTINNYITTLRMTKAKELLTLSELSIKEIAYEVGFQDEKYFMRLFKRSELITAKQYRNTFYHTFINNG